MIPATQGIAASPSSFSRTFEAPCEQSSSSQQQQQQQQQQEQYQHHQTVTDESSPSYLRSQSIPISKNIHRTASELQLCVDEQIADQRDYAFFSRLVNGISKSQSEATNRYLQMENQVCLAHIIQTRQHEYRTVTPEPFLLQQEQEQEDYWGLCRSNNTFVDNYYVHSITSDVIAIASSFGEEDDEGIFDLDL